MRLDRMTKIEPELQHPVYSYNDNTSLQLFHDYFSYHLHSVTIFVSRMLAEHVKL